VMLMEIVVWGKLDVGALEVGAKWLMSFAADLYVLMRAENKDIYFQTINLNLHRRVGSSGAMFFVMICNYRWFYVIGSGSGNCGVIMDPGGKG
jgi:hypothetical protein